MIDERVRRAIQIEAAAVPERRGSLRSVMRRGRRRRLINGLTIAASAAAVVAGGWVASRSLLPSPTPAPPVAPRPSDLEVVDLGGFAAPVEGVLVENPGRSTIYRGTPHETPEFGTEQLGREQPLTIQPLPDDLPPDLEGAGEIVYLGHTGNTAQFLYELGGDLCWASADGVGYCPVEVGLASDGDPETLRWKAVLLRLPKEAAVVALLLDERPVVWQRPVSGAVILDFEADRTRLNGQLEVLDRSGRTLTRERLEPTPEAVDVAGVRVPVATEDRVLTAALGPEPRFDPGGARAVERPLLRSRAVPRLLPRGGVYLGDLQELGAPVYLREREGLCLGVLLKATLVEECVPQADGTFPMTVRAPAGTGPAEGGILGWIGLPPEVAVAVLEVDGSPTYWQRPLGGAAVFEVPHGVPVSLSLVAYDLTGGEIKRLDDAPVP